MTLPICPVGHCIWCSNVESNYEYCHTKTVLSHLTIRASLAGDDGFEPPHLESKSSVLPLDESPIEKLQIEKDHV